MPSREDPFGTSKEIFCCSGPGFANSFAPHQNAPAKASTKIVRLCTKNPRRILDDLFMTYTLRKMMLAFVPPNPKELDNAVRTFFSLALRGTRSMPLQGSDTLCRFKVGGKMPV